MSLKLKNNIKIILIVILFFKITNSIAQSNSIYIEDIGPIDGVIISMWIPRDSNDINLEKMGNVIPFIVTEYKTENSTSKDYDLVECILKTELSETISKGEIWVSNIRIIFYDESFNITDERFVCCYKESEQTFKKLLEKKSVKSNKFTFNLFADLITLIEENNKIG